MGGRVEGRAPTKPIEAMLLVEANFAIGFVWEKRPTLQYLWQICQQQCVQVVIPEVALAEAQASLIKRVDRQLDAIQKFRFWLNDIARAAGMKQPVQQIKRELDGIEAELQRRKHLILKALNIFAQACIIAPLTPQIWTQAYLRWQANMPPFKELDCLVMETLLAFLRRRKAKLRMFLTLDVEDFDHPEIQDEFRRQKTLLLFAPRDVITEFRKFYGVM